MSRNNPQNGNYEMRNVNQASGRQSSRASDFSRNHVDVNYNRRLDGPSHSRVSPSRQNSTSNQSDRNYTNQRPAATYQNLNQPYVGYEGTRPSYSRQNSNASSFHNQDPPHSSQRRNEPSYVYGRPKSHYNQPSEYSNPFDSYNYYDSSNRNAEDYTEVYSRWNISDQAELVNRQHRTTSIHRNAAVRETPETVTSRTFPRSLEDRRNWMSPAGNVTKQTPLEQRANNIANRMEQDGALMEDTPESEQLRREALRDMPQCLTVKRIIKKKLNTTVSRRSKRKPLGLYKNLKYRVSIKASKMQNSLKSLAYSFELWYSSLKTIEGHFGSGVATYFKFFRWLFIMNFLITIFVIGFVVVPQLLYVHVSPADPENESKLVVYESSSGASNETSVIIPEMLWSNFKIKSGSLQNNVSFEFVNIFTGEGYFTNTSLYYGYYTNNHVNLIKNQKYSMPYAYFFTMFSMYVISFIVLSTSMARSYRRSFIETQGGLKNVYAHKIFCGWDYSIATHEAADLKASSIFLELQELLSDSDKKSEQVPCMERFWTRVIQLVVNIGILIKLAATGYILWYLLEKHSSNSNDDEKSTSTIALITAIVINVVMMSFPPIYSFIVRYEDYKRPRAALYITLIRTFLLKTVVVGVFLAFWLTHSKKEKCWETSIGQHIYRLILFDFLFSVVAVAIVEAVRYFIYKKLWNGIGASNFDIANCTLNLMYNQTLFWVGLYFSPLLSVMVVLKLWCTWYVRRTCILYFCQPSAKSWRAAQTQTWFLILSFLSLLLVLIAQGYIIVDVATSNCGPFRDYEYMYEMILMGIFQLEQNNPFWKVLMYLMKPGTVALILVAMCVVVYYLRAKAFAQQGMVDILRNMLLLEAKDKEFLLENISKVTEGQWQYNLQGRAAEVWNSYENATNPAAEEKGPKPREYFGDGDDNISSSSEIFQDPPHSSSSSLFLTESANARHNNVHKKKY